MTQENFQKLASRKGLIKLNLHKLSKTLAEKGIISYPDRLYRIARGRELKPEELTVISELIKKEYEALGKLIHD